MPMLSLELYELPKTAAQLAADLSSPSSSCSVTVRRAAGGPVAWTGEVRPTEDAAARLLLCRLACSGGLRAPEEQPGRQQEMGDIALLWEDRSNQAEVDGEGSVTFSVGSRVARGPGWRDGDQYDGTPPGPGTVTAVRTEVIRSQGKRIRTTIVDVKWGRTGVIGTHFKEGSTEVLRLLPPELKPHIGSEEEVLDVAAISFCVNIQPKGELLARTVFSWVRTLLGLHCDVDPGWSLTVLQQTAPRLKALQLVSPQQQHLDAALAMPLLEGLCVCNVTGPQLQQVVRMASLRRLELHCPPDAPLPVLAFPGTAAGLRWLRCGVHPLVTALALVRAHADTLEELQLVAASTEPYGCPDLARELVRCGLKELKKIVLLRQYAFEAFCGHDKESCVKQKAQIIVSFLCNGGLSVDVLCNECNEGCEAK
ncbi:uncharacterized protein LOC117644045 [Thrips palmi]|uniref:Uncharacterized protein LOC117644045 n=1 Tax=Thrips palmi TaxID=161013 RepID=A0A6P8YY04_THRPL|nr:uncharacterized protein LOC117644045 [Thrips palmi]